ncbi:site-specific DNA-methyltransferase [uncultured Flavobacterium sp.]|uniref:DNA-methyltransferase n=1 Tax=uncultured Flavobacterium sp. TaxID=165435 RepID=UPI002598A6B2|nr:site-specific DNA-methyltransferase [uncultured Flavobacterium sp.]
MLNLPPNPQFCQTDVSGSTFINADCFDVFPFIEDKSIDAIICDLPYGTTRAKWDSIIPFEPLWEQYKRIIKDNGAIVLFGSQPFTSALVMSNPKWFKNEWIWKKHKGTNIYGVKREPLKIHESFLLFSNGKHTYNPQMTEGKPYKQRGSHNIGKSDGLIIANKPVGYAKDFDSSKRYPVSIQEFANHNQKENSYHPTQKPIPLLEYIIKTYTNEGDMVLDNTMGSGTTNLACIKLNRKSIGIEKEKQYYDVAVRRASEYCH